MEPVATQKELLYRETSRRQQAERRLLMNVATGCTLASARLGCSVGVRKVKDKRRKTKD